MTMSISLAHAQTASKQTVNGTILDENSVPIPGVSVLEKGTNNGVVTDFNGQYTINVSGPNAQLQFSYVGYKTQTITVGTQADISMSMEVDTQGLDEVVVVGYGTQKKVTVTGSVATVKAEEITTTKNENVINSLTGKIPGVRIQQRSSEPGAFDNLYDIRGMGNPLIVIDGVPRDGGALARLDPNSIASVSVLKDASAAIYGVRAANGVILVTTKQGEYGKMNITYSGNYGVQEFLNMPNGVNALQYMMLKNEQQKRGFGQNFFTQMAPAFTEADMELYRNGTLQSTDWIDTVMKDFAPQIQHNLSLDGGSEKIKYFFNLGYLTQKGIFKSDDMDYDRWNFRSNVQVEITDRLHAEVLTSGHVDEKNMPNQDLWTMFKYTWNMLPTDQVFANNNPDYPYVLPDNANPYVITNSDYVGYRTNENRNFQGQLRLEYDVPGLEGLKAKGMYSYVTDLADNNRVNTAYSLYQYDPENDSYIGSVAHSPSYVNRYYGKNISTLLQLSLAYSKQFNNAHNVDGLVLYEEGHSTGDNFYAQREFSLGIPYLFAGDAGNQVGYMNAGGLYEVANKALVGKFNYDYKGKYLAEFSFRYDGSSKFKPGSQWGFFPAGSVGWRISEEQFMQNLVSPNVLNNLKIRASYGLLGDDSATGFQYIPGYNYPAGGYIFGGNYVNGLESRGVVNPDLTWYTATTLNLGVDFDMWNGLVGGTAEYFVRNRDGLLATRTTSLPGTVGASLPQENLNSDRTRGLELQLTHRNNIGDFKYNISANVFSTRTILQDVQQTPAGNSYENWRNGQSGRYTNIWWGREYAGQFNSYDQIYSYGINTGGGNQNTIPGDYYYKDLNNDGVIDYKDEHPIATKNLPLVNFGMTIGASWKGFDFNTVLAGATNVYVQYAEQLAEPLMYGRSALVRFLDRWHTEDPAANVFDPSTTWIPGKYPAMGSPNAQGSKAVQDASFLRIKSLELGYTFPDSLLDQLGVTRFRLYVNSYNLATFTGLKGSDPEHPGVEDNFDSYLGGYKYPLNRSYNIGVNVSF